MNTIAIFLIGMAVTSFVSAAPQDRTAKVYEAGKTSGDPVFIQKTHFTENLDGTVTSETTTQDLKGNPAMTEMAVYRGKDLILQKVDQFQKSVHFETEIKNERVIFRQSDLPEGPKNKVHETSEGLFDDFVIGPTSEAFLADHWDELLNGKIVKCRFGVVQIRETIKFEFNLKAKQKLGDKDAIWIQMNPSSFFLGMMLKPIDLYLDAKEKKMLRFVGRTGLFIKVGADLKPMDADIIYEPEAPVPSVHIQGK